MKVEISFPSNAKVEMPEDFNGITVYGDPHSGKFRVKAIQMVTILSDGSLFITADPVDVPMPDVAKAE